MADDLGGGLFRNIIVKLKAVGPAAVIIAIALAIAAIAIWGGSSGPVAITLLFGIAIAYINSGAK